MSKFFVRLVFSMILVAIIASITTPVFADNSPVIPPVTFTCASVYGTSAYAPGNDSTTALQSTSCPTTGKWIVSKINGVTYYINGAYVAGKGLADLTGIVLKAIIKKLTK